MRALTQRKKPTSKPSLVKGVGDVAKPLGAHIAGSRSQKPLMTTLMSFCDHHSDSGPYRINLDNWTLLYCNLDNDMSLFLSVTQFP